MNICVFVGVSINVEKYCGAEQATVDSVKQFMCFSCWMLNFTNTHTQTMQQLLLFHFNNGYANASECLLMLPLSVLFRIIFPRMFSICSMLLNKLCYSPIYAAHQFIRLKFRRYARLFILIYSIVRGETIIWRQFKFRFNKD